MKKINKVLLLSGILFLSAMASVNAQSIGVRVQMRRPAEYERNEREHPNRPSARHVWVSEEWHMQGGRYVYAPGRWAMPEREGQQWVPGHWAPRQHRRGYIWLPGHWR